VVGAETISQIQKRQKASQGEVKEGERNVFVPSANGREQQERKGEEGENLCDADQVVVRGGGERGKGIIPGELQGRDGRKGITQFKEHLLNVLMSFTFPTLFSIY